MWKYFYRLRMRKDSDNVSKINININNTGRTIRLSMPVYNVTSTAARMRIRRGFQSPLLNEIPCMTEHLAKYLSSHYRALPARPSTYPCSNRLRNSLRLAQLQVMSQPFTATTTLTNVYEFGPLLLILPIFLDIHQLRPPRRLPQVLGYKNSCHLLLPLLRLLPPPSAASWFQHVPDMHNYDRINA